MKLEGEELDAMLDREHSVVMEHIAAAGTYERIRKITITEKLPDRVLYQAKIRGPRGEKPIRNQYSVEGRYDTSTKTERSDVWVSGSNDSSTLYITSKRVEQFEPLEGQIPCRATETVLCIAPSGGPTYVKRSYEIGGEDMSENVALKKTTPWQASRNMDPSYPHSKWSEIVLALSRGEE